MLKNFVQSLLDLVYKPKRERYIYSYLLGRWGHDFIVTDCDRKGVVSIINPIKVGSKISGCGWSNTGSYKLRKGNIVLNAKEEDCPYLVLLSEIKWCKNPIDMYTWKGTRISFSKLTVEEQKYVNDQMEIRKRLHRL